MSCIRVRLTDSDGDIDIDELTLTGIGDAIYQCQHLIEKLEERADTLREEDEE
jgi:hypothetical protein